MDRDRDTKSFVLPEGGTKLNESLHKIVNVPGDGNCFFHAVLSSIRNQSTLPASRDHVNFRLDCCSLIYLIIFRPGDISNMKEQPPFLSYKPGELSNKLFQLAYDNFRYVVDTGTIDTRSLIIDTPVPTSTRFFQWLNYDAPIAMSSYLSNPLAERLIDMIYFYYGVREKHEPRYHAHTSGQPSAQPEQQKVASLYKTAGMNKSSLEQCFVAFSRGCRAMLINKSKIGEMVSVWPFAQVIASGFGYNVHYTVEQTTDDKKRKLEAWWTSSSSIITPVYYNSESEYGTLRSIIEGSKQQLPVKHTILLYYSGEHYRAIHYIKQQAQTDTEEEDQPIRALLDTGLETPLDVSRSRYVPPPKDNVINKENTNSYVSPNNHPVLLVQPNNLIIVGKTPAGGNLSSDYNSTIHKRSTPLQTVTKSSFIDADVNENDTIGVDANNWEYMLSSYHYSNTDNTGSKSSLIKLTDPIPLYIYNMKLGLKSCIGSFLLQNQYRNIFGRRVGTSNIDGYSELDGWELISLKTHPDEFSKYARNSDSPILACSIYVFDLNVVESPSQAQTQGLMREQHLQSNGQRLADTGLTKQLVYCLGNTKVFNDQYENFEIEIFQSDVQRKKVERIGFKKQYEEEPCHFITSPIILQDYLTSGGGGSGFTQAHITHPRYLLMLLKNYNAHQLANDWYFIDPTQIQNEETNMMSDVLLDLHC
jgi:hypothetical protein